MTLLDLLTHYYNYGYNLLTVAMFFLVYSDAIEENGECILGCWSCMLPLFITVEEQAKQMMYSFLHHHMVIKRFNFILWNPGGD